VSNKLRGRHLRSHASCIGADTDTVTSSPAYPPYESALSLTSSEVYLPTYPVTRAEYLEHGSSICRRRFRGPSYNVNAPGFNNGDAGDISDDERERRYAMGLESKKGKGKRKAEEEEVTSGNWGGRRRRAAGLGGAMGMGM
jgi:actin-related protein 6